MFPASRRKGGRRQSVDGRAASGRARRRRRAVESVEEAGERNAVANMHTSTVNDQWKEPGMTIAPSQPPLQSRGASDSSGVCIISVPSSRHSLESRTSGDKCATLRGAVVDAPALRSVQAQDVRRTGAREKVCCLPTRMMSIVLDRKVPREEVADPIVCSPQLGGQCKTPSRIHN